MLTVACPRARHDAIALRDDEVAFDHDLCHARVFEVIEFGEGDDAVTAISIPPQTQYTPKER